MAIYNIMYSHKGTCGDLQRPTQFALTSAPTGWPIGHSNNVQVHEIVPKREV